MTKKAQTGNTSSTDYVCVVGMYLDSQLKGQVRDFNETESAFSVIKDEFFTH